jgi:very-short-patch-repair endonuclease
VEERRRNLRKEPWAREWQTSGRLWEKLLPLARQKRHEPTPAENALWQRLRSRKLNGLRFRRQHSFERFIVDFYCAEAKLVIEVDGPVHDYTIEEDKVRQEFLESLGLQVLRVTNDEVLKSPNTVRQTILSITRNRPAHVLPLSEIGEGDGG